MQTETLCESFARVTNRILSHQEIIENVIEKIDQHRAQYLAGLRKNCLAYEYKSKIDSLPKEVVIELAKRLNAEYHAPTRITPYYWTSFIVHDVFTINIESYHV